MTTSRSILNIDESDNSALTISRIDKADFVLIDSAVLANGGREAVYQRIGGDAVYPLTVRVGFYPSNGKGANVSVKINTWTQTTVDSVVTETVPFTATLATHSDGPVAIPDITDYLALIGNLLSIFVPVDNAGTPDTAALQSLQFGVPQLLA